MEQNLLTAGGTTGKSGEFQLKFIPSKNGGRILVRGGYRHYLKRTNKSGTSIWVCHKRAYNGSVVLDETQSILRDKKHCCIPDFESVDIKLEMIDLKKKVATDDRPILTLYEEQMAPYKTEEYADKLPTFQRVRDSLYKARRVGTIRNTRANAV